MGRFGRQVIIRVKSGQLAAVEASLHNFLRVKAMCWSALKSLCFLMSDLKYVVYNKCKQKV